MKKINEIVNSDDYESYLEYIEDEEMTKKERKRSKIKKKTLILSEWDNMIVLVSHKKYDIYNFNGSNLYVVDKENKKAWHCVEPREYDSIIEVMEEDWNIPGDLITAANLLNASKFITIE